MYLIFVRSFPLEMHTENKNQATESSYLLWSVCLFSVILYNANMATDISRRRIRERETRLPALILNLVTGITLGRRVIRLTSMHRLSSCCNSVSIRFFGDVFS